MLLLVRHLDTLLGVTDRGMCLLAKSRLCPECFADVQLGPRDSRAEIRPPLLTEMHRYDRFSLETSMKSRRASPCQREECQFESGLVLQ
jgi:hypothetical protein